ncbi:helix-turn-helix domain-containing protein [Streptomyces rochei]|uniref:helix-turn-helix domain-containing protein n=1 Tax=Streptomyces rochei TaxID=1928 RepID=UPI0036459B46
MGDRPRSSPSCTTADRTHHGSGRGSDAGDVGRRLAAARRRKGLSVQAVAAERARMAPGYLAYLETHTADPGSGTLMRLADALGTTYGALQGGGTDRPPGRESALRDPHLLDLGEEECRGLLSSHGVGRIAFTSEHGPAVFPVNYEMTDGAWPSVPPPTRQRPRPWTSRLPSRSTRWTTP